MERQRWFTWRRLLAGFGILVVGTVLLALVAWQWVFAGYRSGTLVHGGDHSVPITRSAVWVTPTNNRDTDAIQLAFDFLLQFRRDSDRVVKAVQ